MATDLLETPHAEGEANEEGLLIRPEATLTLEEFVDNWTEHDDKQVQNITQPYRMTSALTDDKPHITVEGKEILVDSDSIVSLYDALGMPYRYIATRPQDEQQYYLDAFLQNNEYSGELSVITDRKNELINVRKGGFMPQAGRIAKAVAKVMPEDSLVRDAWTDAETLGLDVYAPPDHSRWSVGDKKVGDLTQVGVRIRYRYRYDKVPEVAPFFYRLICTNGWEVRDEGAKIDARDPNLKENIYDQLSAMVTSATELGHSRAQQYYNMRNRKLSINEDISGNAYHLLRDAGISRTPSRRIVDRMAQFEEPTEFDLANIVTNLANGYPRTDRARSLQQSGGSLAMTHAARCASCHRKIEEN